MTLDTIITIAWIIMGAFAVGVVAYIVWYRVYRPKLILKSSKPTDHSGIPRKDTSALIPVKDIKDGFVTIDGEYRFIRSMKTTGQDLFLAEESEQYRTQAAYQQFFRTIQYPITFRIDSSSCDLSIPIEEHQKALQKIETEYGEAVTQFAMLEQAFQKAETDMAKHDILFEMVQSDKHVTAYENAIKHLEQQIAFLEAHNGGEKNPIIEQRYIYEWSYNPDDFPNDADLIRKRAENELAALERSMSSSLLNAGVKSSRDDDKAMFDLSYRHYHPYAGLIYRDHDQTDYEEKLNRGKAYYDVNLKKYRAIKQDPIIIEGFKKIEEEVKKKAEPMVLDKTEEETAQAPEESEVTIRTAAEKPKADTAKAEKGKVNFDEEDDQGGGINL